MHAEARTQMTEARKPYLCRWATSLGAMAYILIVLLKLVKVVK